MNGNNDIDDCGLPTYFANLEKEGATKEKWDSIIIGQDFGILISRIFLKNPISNNLDKIIYIRY